ncbi:MAG: MBL fold metallo-hydrolase [Phycisphaerae bacterium]|jgi:metallo-beta-lactamase family protein|nr:MBL fold metallo-hydrolase [Phycisphaerae bacterium]
MGHSEPVRSIFYLFLFIIFALCSCGIAGDGSTETTVVWYGGGGQIGGSLAVVHSSGMNIIVDCGALYNAEDDSRKQSAKKSVIPLPDDVIKGSALLLTHAHLDHCGRLPQLVRAGFKQPINTTPATRELLPVMLEMAIRYGSSDRTWYWSAKSVKQGSRGPFVTAHWRENCEWGQKISPVNRRQVQGNHDEVSKKEQVFLRPCDSCVEEELRSILQLVQVREIGQVFPISGHLNASFLAAGHIPGAASVLLAPSKSPEGKRLLFSGDIGNDLSPLECAPTPAPPADRIWLEATYGSDIRAKDATPELNRFRQEISTAVANGEVVWIPAFALDRTQKVLYQLGLARNEGKLPSTIQVFCPSPSAAKVSAIYRRELSQPSTTHWFRPELYRIGPSAFPEMVRKLPGTLPRPSVLVTTSGMMDEAFSEDLLDDLLPQSTTRVLLVGWADPKTPAGLLASGAKKLEKRSRDDPNQIVQTIGVRAKVSQYKIFSAHADLSDTLYWLSRQDKRTEIRLVHGDPEQLAARQAALIKAGFLNVKIERAQQTKPISGK